MPQSPAPDAPSPAGDGAAAARRQDEAALRDLVARFALALDERRWDDYAALYADDAVLKLPHAEVHGRTAIRQLVAADLGRYTATHHGGGHVVVDHHPSDHGDGDGRTATVKTTLLGTHVEGDDPRVHWTGGGWYHLEVRRSGGRWLITSAEPRPAWLRIAPGARGPLPGPEESSPPRQEVSA